MIPFDSTTTAFDGGVPFDATGIAYIDEGPCIVQQMPVVWHNSTYFHNAADSIISFVRTEDDLYTPALPQQIQWKPAIYTDDDSGEPLSFFSREDEYFSPQVTQYIPWTLSTYYFEEQTIPTLHWAEDSPQGSVEVVQGSWTPATYIDDDSGEPLKRFGIDEDLYTPQRAQLVQWHHWTVMEDRVAWVGTQQMLPVQITGRGVGTVQLSATGVGTIFQAGQGSRIEGLSGEGSSRIDLTGKNE